MGINRVSGIIQTINSDIQRLDYVTRFSSIPVKFKELVSTHSYWVSIYSALIHNGIEKDERLMSYILVHALTHDVTEALTGDFVRIFKYSSINLKNEINKGEENSIKFFQPELINLINYHDNLSSIDKEYVETVVKAADFVSLWRFIRREVHFGNHELSSFHNQMELDLLGLINNYKKKICDAKTNKLLSVFVFLIALFDDLVNFKEISGPKYTANMNT